MVSITYRYNCEAKDPFANHVIMDFIEAKMFIETAYRKRDALRAAVHAFRRQDCNRTHIGHAWSQYRRAQKLSVAAQAKCLADMRASNQWQTGGR